MNDSIAGGARPGDPASEGGAPASAAEARRSKGPFVMLISVLVIAFGWLLWGGLDSNIIYFLEPHELLAKGTDGMNKPVRLGGLVQPGTVVWDSTSHDLRFLVTDTTQIKIRVKSTGTPPPMFRDGMGVILEGRLGSDTTFAATSLIIKHSNEYRAPKAGERPQEMYKTLFKGGQK